MEMRDAELDIMRENLIVEGLSWSEIELVEYIFKKDELDVEDLKTDFSHWPMDVIDGYLRRYLEKGLIEKDYCSRRGDSGFNYMITDRGLAIRKAVEENPLDVAEDKYTNSALEKELSDAGVRNALEALIENNNEMPYEEFEKLDSMESPNYRFRLHDIGIIEFYEREGKSYVQLAESASRAIRNM